MLIRKLLEMAKRFSHKQILACAFLALIFFVGAATFPSSMVNVVSLFQDEKASTENTLLAAKVKIDDEYLNMLTFKGANFQNKGTYINLNGFMARIMGQRYMNQVIKLKNDHLSFIPGKHNVTLAATQLTKVCNRQKSKGKDFLFVLAPCQVPKYQNILPAGYVDYSNPSSDELLELLRKNNVPVLDLREEMLNDNISYTDAFFKADHHWKPETGFYAYKKILDYFIKKKIIEADNSKYTDIKEYNVETYKNWYLGSLGKRTGRYFTGVDDFSIITPKFETSMSAEIPSLSINKQGSFAEIGFDMSANKLDYFSANPYGVYGNKDRDFIRYRNASAPVNLKVLSWGDSFTNSSLTFLPLIFKKCDELDMRHYKGNFEEYY